MRKKGQQKKRRESTDEFCKRLGIGTVYEKGGREFVWNGPAFHGSQAYGTKRKITTACLVPVK